MPRYFLELAYVGTNYSGFQVQPNANTVQAEVTRALNIFYRTDFELTGSSRTDARVHALQNFFHFDTNLEIQKTQIYNLNSLLPHDIVIKNILAVHPDAHCRFDALSRTYYYYITSTKNPFLYETAYYYPYALDVELLQSLAAFVPGYKDFSSFSKRKTQVNHFKCNVEFSRWVFEKDVWRYEIIADRFLRGMVKGLVGTMLLLAKNNQGLEDMQKIFASQDCNAADFSAPSKGLFLIDVKFEPQIFL